ncbi:MAG: hypothetical protein IH971_06190 [Candidatus Marinimicrobia bacterium]|nr:hypothetical protein [Candidatus Neomarinimicrobiota bacterium]
MKSTRFSYLLLSSLFILGCNTGPPFDIQNLNGNRIGVMGHRGKVKGSIYPGNSFESIEQVLKMGADGSEIDVQITRDSVLVMYHDEDLSTKTNFTGVLRDYDWAELDSCTYRSTASVNIYVVSVDDLFSRLADVQNYYFSFDTKFYPGAESRMPYYRQFVYAIQQVIEKHNMHNRVFIEAGNIQFLQMLQQNRVQVLRFVTGSKFKDALRIAEELGLYGIGIGSKITRNEIRMAHDKGFRVMTWTPKTPRDNIKAINKNPDFVQTDQPVHMLRVLGRYKDLH